MNITTDITTFTKRTTYLTLPEFSQALLKVLRPDLLQRLGSTEEKRVQVLQQAIITFTNLYPSYLIEGNIPDQQSFEWFLETGPFLTAQTSKTNVRMFPEQNETLYNTNYYYNVNSSTESSLLFFNEPQQGIQSAPPVFPLNELYPPTFSFEQYMMSRYDYLNQKEYPMSRRDYLFARRKQILHTIFPYIPRSADKTMKSIDLYIPESREKLIEILRHGGTITLESYFNLVRGTQPSDEMVLELAELILCNNHTLKQHAGRFKGPNDYLGEITFRNVLTNTFKHCETEINLQQPTTCTYPFMCFYQELPHYNTPMQVYLSRNNQCEINKWTAFLGSARQIRQVDAEFRNRCFRLGISGRHQLALPKS